MTKKLDVNNVKHKSLDSENKFLNYMDVGSKLHQIIYSFKVFKNEIKVTGYYTTKQWILWTF